jgi:hypothetical protein
MERHTREKHSSLLQKFVNDELKKLLTLGSGANYIKHFCQLFTNFRTKEFVRIGWKSIPMTNTPILL